MGTGTGVSYTETGPHRWKLRWREKKPGQKARSRAIRIEGSEIERDALILEIRRSLAKRGYYDPAVSEVLPLGPAQIGDLLAACIASRRAAGKYSESTARIYKAYATRFVKRVRELEHLETRDEVPVTLLARSLFDRVQALDMGRGSSPMMRYAPLRLAVDAWRWGADANDEATAAGRPAVWPFLPPAPRSTRDYLPRVPRYGRTIAPSLAHVDATLRRLWARPRVDRGTKIAALFLRFTGLRSAQVFSIRREDIDLNERTLFVRAGKTQAEKADARTVPLSAALLSERGVQTWLDGITSGPVFPKRQRRRTKEPGAGRTKQPSRTFAAAWQDATDTEEVPRHVWAPPNRKVARPEHSLRAAFQAHLEEQRVPGNVIDFLVGHEGETVRDVHYGRELLSAARAAVDAMPPVDWTGPCEELEDNVVPMRR